MKKLKQLTKTELINKYWDKFGISGDNIPASRLIASLFYGKQASYLTSEELDSINDY